MADCFYFGCWNKAGHYMHAPGGRTWGDDLRGPELFGPVFGRDQVKHHLDGSLAPKRDDKGRLWWGAKLDAQGGRDASGSMINAGECPQGQFLLHVLDNGYTAIQWWDRCQGDTRGACNSTILLKGEHTADEMIAAAREHFPHVLANLEKAGVQLVEVKHG